MSDIVNCSSSNRHAHRRHKVSHEVVEEEMRQFLPNSTTGINSPTSGLFFYADLTSDHVGSDQTDPHPHLSMSFQMGDQAQNFQGLISTSTALTTMVSSKCSSLCQVPQKLELISNGLEDDVDSAESQLQSYEMTYFNHGTIEHNTLFGRRVTEEFQVAAAEDGADFDLPVLAIENALISFNLPYSGSVGLAPPYSMQAQSSSLLLHAQQNRDIDHLVFSIYSRENKSNLSIERSGSESET